MNKRNRKVIFFFLKMAVSLGLVFWLIDKVNWALVWEKTRAISLPWLLLYLTLQLSGNVISAKKWQIIARFKKITLSVKECFFVYLTGAFINNFLPGTIGGDAYRGLWLTQKTASKTIAFSTIIFDRFTGLWTTAFLALVFSLLFIPHLLNEHIVATTLVAIVLFLALDIVLTYIYKKEWLHQLLRYLPEKVVTFIDEVASFTETRMWTTASLYAALFALVGVGLNNYVLFLSLGTHINLMAYLSLIFLITLIANIPISINNIGIKEWAYVIFFGLVGVSAETAITVALVSRFLQMLLSFMALPYYANSQRKAVVQRG